MECRESSTGSSCSSDCHQVAGSPSSTAAGVCWAGKPQDSSVQLELALEEKNAVSSIILPTQAACRNINRSISKHTNAAPIFVICPKLGVANKNTNNNNWAELVLQRSDMAQITASTCVLDYCQLSTAKFLYAVLYFLQTGNSPQTPSHAMRVYTLYLRFEDFFTEILYTNNYIHI